MKHINKKPLSLTLLFIVGMMFFIAITVQSYNADIKAAAASESSPYSDLQAMKAYADLYLDGKWTWIAKHTGVFASIASEKELHAQAEQLKQLLSAITEGKDTADLQIDLNLSALPSGHSYLVLQVTGDEQSDMAAADEALSQLHAFLLELQIEPAWQTMIQGETNVYEDWHTFKKDIAAYWDTDIGNVYEDAQTLSLTAQSPYLSRSLSGADINMQAALHRHSESESMRLTLGSPMITIEY